MVGSLLNSLVRVLLDLMATSHGDQAKLLAEVLALRRQIQVLERQIKGVRWTSGDRMIMAALRERLPRSAWAYSWSSPRRCSVGAELWCAESGRPIEAGRPRLSAESRTLILRMP